MSDTTTARYVKHFAVCGDATGVGASHRLERCRDNVSPRAFPNQGHSRPWQDRYQHLGSETTGTVYDKVGLSLITSVPTLHLSACAYPVFASAARQTCKTCALSLEPMCPQEHRRAHGSVLLWRAGTELTSRVIDLPLLRDSTTTYQSLASVASLPITHLLKKLRAHLSPLDRQCRTAWLV